MQVQVLVTVDVEDCDPDTFRATEAQAQAAALEAVEGIVKHGEANGFAHALAEHVCIGVVAVETYNGPEI
jgi:hypothetical protein